MGKFNVDERVNLPRWGLKLRRQGFFRRNAQSVNLPRWGLKLRQIWVSAIRA